MVICLERGADLHLAELMPLPLSVSCFSKIQIGFTFWYHLTWVVLVKGPINGSVYTVCFYASINRWARGLVYWLCIVCACVLGQMHCWPVCCQLLILLACCFAVIVAVLFCLWCRMRRVLFSCMTTMFATACHSSQSSVTTWLSSCCSLSLCCSRPRDHTQSHENSSPTYRTAISSCWNTTLSHGTRMYALPLCFLSSCQRWKNWRSLQTITASALLTSTLMKLSLLCWKF